MPSTRSAPRPGSGRRGTEPMLADRSATIADPEDRLARRERAARRWIGAAAWAAALVGSVGWLLGPVLFLLIWPYTSGARLTVGASVLCIAVGAAGLWMGALDLWRDRRGAPENVPRDLGRVLFFALVAGGPTLAWWPFWLWALAHGVDLDEWHWLAWLITAIGSLPAVPLVLALVAWARSRRLAPGWVATAPPTSRWAPAVVASLGALTILLALAWPGGPRPTGGAVFADGRSADTVIREWHAEHPEIEHELSRLGWAGAQALGAQLPADAGLRPFLAHGMTGVFHYGGRVAPMLEGVYVDAGSPSRIIETLGRFGEVAGPLAEVVAEAARSDERVHPHTPCGALMQMGAAGFTQLLGLLDSPRARLSALGGLSEVGRPQGNGDARVAAQIEPWLDAPDEATVLGAAIAYAAFAEPDASRARAVPILRRALGSTDWPRSFQAAGACERLGPAAREATPELLAVATNLGPGSSPASDAAWRALGRVGDPDAAVLAALSARLATPVGTWRGPTPAVLRAVADLADHAGSLRPAVASLVAAPRADVRIAAIEALVRLDGTIDPWVPQLRKELAPPAGVGRHGEMLESLTRLGPVARPLLPDLQALRAGPTRRGVWDAALDRTISAIQAAPRPAQSSR